MQDDIAGDEHTPNVAGMLIDTARLADRLNDADWIVFDCRHDLGDPAKGARLYAEGHIPGAHFAPVDTALSGAKSGTNGRHPLPSPEDFSAFLTQHGVSSSTQVVAYDDVGGMYAARLWWLARWIGLTQVRVLDGGWPKWIAEGRRVSNECPAVRTPGAITPKPDASRLASSTEILATLNTRDALVIDARAAERYRGDIEPIDKVAGHIPEAVNRFYKTNLNADHTLRPPDELRREFEAVLAGQPPSTVIHQCGSGITACANLLAMEHAGLAGSRLYAGSWSEWIADPSRPVAKG